MLGDIIADSRATSPGIRSPWAYGTDLEYMRGLVGDWKDSFDWRGQEAALNAYPQFKVKLHAISALPGCSAGRQCASP